MARSTGSHLGSSVWRYAVCAAAMCRLSAAEALVSDQSSLQRSEGAGSDQTGCKENFGDCTVSKCCLNPDFKCRYVTGWFSQCRDTAPEAPITLAGFKVVNYSLNWEAQGKRFFQDFKYFTHDASGGTAALQSSMLKAVRHGVLGMSSDGKRAMLRAGERTGKKFKRHGIKIGTKKKWTHFLMAISFEHLPFGCGVSPQIYTQAGGKTWPEGGSMDLLSYSNDLESFTSFHTTSNCTLKVAAVNKFKQMTDAHSTDEWSDYNCHSDASKDAYGCAPNVKPFRTGKDWGKTPGVLAMQRAPGFVKVFFIPHDKIPKDLADGQPTPEWWDAFMISFYPFSLSGDSCADDEHVMEKQRIMLGINFCGNKASSSWGDSTECVKEGPRYNESLGSLKGLKIKKKKNMCRAVNPAKEHAPKQDCCTQFIDDSEHKFHTDKYLKKRAFFEINWIRVFT